LKRKEPFKKITAYVYYSSLGIWLNGKMVLYLDAFTIENEI
jgi:hypothetical protein